MPQKFTLLLISLCILNLSSFADDITELKKKLRKAKGREAIQLNLDIANKYLEINYAKSALKYAENALALSKNHKIYKRTEQNLYRTLGEVYYKNKKFGNSVKFYDKELKSLSTSKYSKERMICYYNLGKAKESAKLIASLKSFSSAETYYEKSLEIALNIKDDEYEEKNYIALYKLMKKKGKSLEAKQYYDAYKKLGEIEQKDRAISIKDKTIKKKENEIREVEKDLKEITTEKEKVEDKVKLNEAELLASEERNKKNLFIIIGLIAIVILVLFFSYFLRKQYIEKRRANNQLQILNKQLTSKNDELAYKNEQIDDSIQYAKKIQESILISEQELKEILPASFVYFRPKDVLSGDFYWVNKVGDTLIVAVVDCTGHGVPGAMMSMIGNSLLNKIILEKKIYSPEKVLNQLHLDVVDTLQQLKNEEFSQDGMDLSLCFIDLSTRKLKFAGARNDLWIIQNGDLEILDADFHSIGGRPFRPDESHVLNFTLRECQLQSKANIFLFSDGYPDQFGGPKNMKFNMQNFQELLLEISLYPISEQQHIVEKAMDEWRGEQKQVDDMLVVGFEI